MKIISTIHPYCQFLDKIIEHSAISGVRINGIMQIKKPMEDRFNILKSQANGKDIWFDLKCRQIRTKFCHLYNEVADAAKEKFHVSAEKPRAKGALTSPPWASLKITHKIKVDLSKGPVKCWFNDGYDNAHLVDIIDGDTLIMLDGPRKLMGGGESINILDPSLEIDGFFTDEDLEFIESAKKADIHNYMLSYVESNDDIKALLELDPDANIVAKIESSKGLKWVDEHYKDFAPKVRLMAARGDLYIEVGSKRPEKIIEATQVIVKADPNAIVASRLMGSLRDSPRPSCADVMDVKALINMGYEHFMVGDDICFNENSILLALDIMKAIGKL